MTGRAVGVDVGGTNVRVALVDADHAVLHRVAAPTLRGDVGSLVETVAGLVEDLDAEGAPVGVGVAGIVDHDGVVRYGANVGLSDAPLARLLRARLGRCVVVRNDATVAMWGEHVAGAAVGVDDAVLLTVGTGVGGGVVTGGVLLEGASGLAAELGHMVVLEGGRDCTCGNQGCLEAYASGTAIASRATARLATWDRPTSLPDAPDGSQVVDAAHAGDELAVEVVQEVGRWLGVGAAGLVNALDPAVVVVGGGAGEAAFDLLAPAMVRSLRGHVYGLAHRTVPDVVPAALGDRAGVVGAAELARTAALDAR